MRAIRFIVGTTLAPILTMLPIIGHGTGAATGEQALPALDREAVLRCVAAERESRELLERHRERSDEVAASGHVLDADRRELESLRATVDPRDGAAVAGYNARAKALDARIRQHNARLASLEAGLREQQAVAQRYNANCGGRHYQPDALRPAPARQDGTGAR